MTQRDSEREAMDVEIKGDGADAQWVPVGADEYVDARWPAGKVALRPQSGSQVTAVGHIFDVTYFNEERLFPRFRSEEVPTRSRIRKERVKLGPVEEHNDGNGNCWTECQMVERETKSKYILVTQYYEIWRINRTLREWYSGATGEAMGHIGTGVALGSLPASAGATGAVGVASTAAGVLGVGMAAFVSTTYLMEDEVRDEKRISAGWRLSELSGYVDEVVRESTPFWDRCSEVHPCGAPAPEAPAARAPDRPASAPAAAPPPLKKVDTYTADHLPWWDIDWDTVDTTPDPSGAYVDPGWPEGQVRVEPIETGTDDYVVERRLFGRFFKSEVPTRVQRRAEHRRLGPTREANDGKGLCWTECQMQDFNWLRRYYIVEQWQQIWKIDVSRRDYYDWVGGLTPAHAGTVGAGAGAVLDKSAVDAAFGKGTAKAFEPEVTKAGSFVGKVGFSLAFFQSVTALMRHWINEQEEVSYGWALAPEYSGYEERETLEKESTPYWARCSEPHECEPHKPVLHGRSGWTHRRRGKVDRRIATGALATGLLTIGLVVFGLTAGADAGSQSVVATESPVATAVVAPSAVSAIAPVAGTVALSSPPPGAAVFTQFRNDLTEITISGGFAPPPGTHPSHTSVFTISATDDQNGADLAAVWRLDDPVCGQLVGADRHNGQTSWPHGGCRTLETSARVTVIVAKKTEFDADWNVKPGSAYFVYTQTARAGDATETANLPKNAQLQYFGPAPRNVPASAPAATQTSSSQRTPAPWVPFVALAGACACGALIWRSGLVALPA